MFIVFVVNGRVVIVVMLDMSSGVIVFFVLVSVCYELRNVVGLCFGVMLVLRVSRILLESLLLMLSMVVNMLN